MKRCRRCGETKPTSEFNRSPKNRDGHHSYCRECQKQYYRDNYSRHLNNVRRTSAALKVRMREIVNDAMAGGCVDCGAKDIRVLEFDHVRGEKIRSIGEMVRRGTSEESLIAEIAKM